MKRILSICLFALLAVAKTVSGQTGTEQQTASQTSIRIDTTSGWQVVYSNPVFGAGARAISQLQFASKDTGYAFAYDGARFYTLRSTDAGLSWDALPTEPPQGTWTWVSSLLGYCSLFSPDIHAVYRTTDGGASWVAFDRKSVASAPIAFANQDTGIVFGFQRNARTTDGGITWNEVDQPIGLAPDAACFADGQVGYAVGSVTPFPQHPELPDAGYCEKTTDGGATWTQINTGIPNSIAACHAIDPDKVIVSGGSFIGRTTDGGVSWERYTDLSRIVRYGLSISFCDSLHGVVAGSNGNNHGQVCVTQDGGNTWNLQFLPQGVPLITGVAMLSDTAGLFCAGGNIYRTTTGGLASGIPSQPSVDIQVQIFPNPTNGPSTIQYTLPSAASVSLVVTDAQGVVVANYAAQLQDVGPHSFLFDATSLPSGTYFFKLTTSSGAFGGKIEVRR